MSLPFQDTDLPLAQRIDDLLGRLTLPEKTSQLLNESPAIERLEIPEYNWWNEALHGVARAGRATVFPQAIGLAATFDPELIQRVGTAISDEGRAKYHAALRIGNRRQYLGLTFWSPNINIFRDPRWGRGHETYGEDPYLTGVIATAFIRGLQGDDPERLKTAACAKHYAVHSGPEQDRHHFDAVVSQKDLWETYLPAFETCVREAGVESVMSAYNRTNGEACSASKTLLTDILRQRWGFKGHVMSDCGAVNDIHASHHITQDAAESAALAVRNGCDLNCGCVYKHLPEALARGLISEAEIDVALRRMLSTRFRLGMFDEPDTSAYAQIPESVVSCEAHRELALATARASIVLLKNNGILPLRRDYHSLFVTGPNAGNTDVLLANYNGMSARLTTVVEGIVGKVGAGTKLNFAAGCDLTGEGCELGAISYQAADADVVIAVMGLSPRLEGEEGDAADSDGGGDRRHLDLPGQQTRLLQHLKEMGKKLVVVLMNGSAVAVNWAQEHADAVLTAWYPGEAGGSAVADVLFGDCNPGGRLPVTFYRSLDDLPPFSEYAMANRTYRYFAGTPLYPFGFGLSYAEFSYAGGSVSNDRLQASETLTVTATVGNDSAVDGDEVVQVYVSREDVPFTVPRQRLIVCRRVKVAAGARVDVTLTIPARRLHEINDEGKATWVPGQVLLTVGGCSPGARGIELGAAAPLTLAVTLTD